MNQNVGQKSKLNLVWVAAGVIAALLVGGYFLWKGAQKTSEEKAADAVSKSVESATQGVLPTINTNPLEKLPELNPIDKTNPFKNIITNPFE